MKASEYIITRKNDILLNSTKDNNLSNDKAKEIVKRVQVIISLLRPYRFNEFETREVINNHFENAYIDDTLVIVWLMKAIRLDDTYVYAYNYIAQKENRKEGYTIRALKEVDEIKLYEHIEEDNTKVNQTILQSVSDWSIVFYYLYSAGAFEDNKIREIEKFIEDNNILNPKGIKTTKESFKKEENEIRNRINGKTNKHGDVEWNDKYPPLPTERIKKILPFIKKNKKALQIAKNDILRLPVDIEEYKEKRH